MTTRQRVFLETFVFCGFACLISTITMLGAVGTDPSVPHPPQVQQVSR
jgi:hypothetical protein